MYKNDRKQLGFALTAVNLFGSQPNIILEDLFCMIPVKSLVEYQKLRYLQCLRTTSVVKVFKRLLFTHERLASPIDPHYCYYSAVPNNRIGRNKRVSI